MFIDKAKQKLLNRIYQLSKERYGKMCDRSSILYEAAAQSRPLYKKEKEGILKLNSSINSYSERFNDAYNQLLDLGFSIAIIDEYLFYNKDMFGVSPENKYIPNRR